MMPLRLAMILGLVVTALVSARASALASALASAEPPILERVDEGVDDVDPLATSFSEPRSDLRTPFGFEHVYRLPGRDDVLIRADGALFAVFPLSRYAYTATGEIPLVPDNTVYHIGESSLASLLPPPPDRSNPPLDRRVATAAAIDMDHRDPLAVRRELVLTDGLVAAPPDRGPDPGRGRHHAATTPEDTTLPRLSRDHAYRSQRLRELLYRAAGQAARGRSSSGSSK